MHATIFVLHYHMQKGMQKLLFIETPGRKSHFLMLRRPARYESEEIDPVMLSLQN